MNSMAKFTSHLHAVPNKIKGPKKLSLRRKFNGGIGIRRLVSLLGPAGVQILEPVGLHQRLEALGRRLRGPGLVLAPKVHGVKAKLLPEANLKVNQGSF